MVAARERDEALAEMQWLRRCLAVRLRNQAREKVIMMKLNWLKAKESGKHEKLKKKQRKEYESGLKGKSSLLDWDYEPKWRDVKTGQKEPIEVLVKMVDELARKHKDLIPMEMVEIYPSASADKSIVPIKRDVNEPPPQARESKYATLVPEDELLPHAELGREDRYKVLEQELYQTRIKIQRALIEQDAILKTMKEDNIFIPRLTFSWNRRHAGISTMAYSYGMQARITKKDIAGLADDHIGFHEKMRREEEILKLKIAAGVRDKQEHESWREKAVARTSSLHRTLTELGTRLRRRASMFGTATGGRAPPPPPPRGLPTGQYQPSQRF